MGTNADKGMEGTKVVHIFRTSFMDDPKHVAKVESESRVGPTHQDFSTSTDCSTFSSKTILVHFSR